MNILTIMRAVIIALPLIAVGTHYASAEPSALVDSGVIDNLVFTAPDHNCGSTETIVESLLNNGFYNVDYARPHTTNNQLAVFHNANFSEAIVVVSDLEHSCIVAGY